MAPTSSIDDRWLWLGVGILGFLTVKGIQYAFNDLVHLIQLDAAPESNAEENDLPENELSLEDLKVLVESPNYNISSSAVSMVIERLTRYPGVHRSIIDDARQTDDEDLRARAKRVLGYLRDSRAPIRRGDRPHPTWSPVTISPSASPSLLGSDHHGTTSPDLAERTHDELELEMLNIGDRPLIPSEAQPIAGWTDVPRARRASDPQGEADRRRQRREAMVLREADGLVQEEDIIRPRLDD